MNPVVEKVKELLEKDTKCKKECFEGKGGGEEEETKGEQKDEGEKKCEKHKKYDYLVLVGGNSMSGYVRSVLYEKFGPYSEYGINIYLPPKPILNVVEGAVLWPKHRGFIKYRRMPVTYGIHSEKGLLGCLLQGVPRSHILCNSRHFFFFSFSAKRSSKIK